MGVILVGESALWMVLTRSGVIRLISRTNRCLFARDGDTEAIISSITDSLSRDRLMGEKGLIVLVGSGKSSVGCCDGRGGGNIC